MAKRIKQLDEAYRSTAGRYNWTQWLDGNAWELERGVDFDCLPNNFRAVAQSHANKKGLLLATRVRGDKVQIQASKRT